MWKDVNDIFVRKKSISFSINSGYGCVVGLLMNLFSNFY